MKQEVERQVFNECLMVVVLLETVTDVFKILVWASSSSW